MARILVIDDDVTTLALLEDRLRRLGHDVTSSRGGAEGIRLAAALVPELVILELALPDVSGTEVCRALRAGLVERRPGLLVVSSRGDEIDRIVGFELGADDYVVKPFSERELLLRVRAVLRRAAPPPTEPEAFELGDLRVDRDAHRAWLAGREIPLTALEFRLLVALHQARERVLTRKSLLDAVWGSDGRSSARAVDTAVKRLRERLGGAGDLIETVRKVGYRFGAPREAAAAPHVVRSTRRGTKPLATSSSGRRAPGRAPADPGRVRPQA